jgi:hypothetical protein
MKHRWLSGEGGEGSGMRITHITSLPWRHAGPKSLHFRKTTMAIECRMVGEGVRQEAGDGWDAEAKGGELETSLGYTAIPFLKTKPNQTKTKKLATGNLAWVKGTTGERRSVSSVVGMGWRIAL